MKNIVYLPSRDPETSVRFYTDVLGLFHLVEDLGLGSRLLRYARSEHFYLMTSPELSPRADGPAFSIEVPDCDAEFERLTRTPLADGCLAPAVTEYPLGKFFGVVDPDGNVFSVYEWFI